MVGMHTETFVNSETGHAEVDVGEHRGGVLYSPAPGVVHFPRCGSGLVL